MAIDAYVPGKSAAAGGAKTYKLSANETPLGPSPRAVAAFARAAGSLEFYPEARRGGCAKRSRRATGSTPPASSAAAVRTIS